MNTKKTKILFIADNGYSADSISGGRYPAEIVPINTADRERINKEILTAAYSACVIRSNAASENEFELLQLVRTHSPSTKVIVSVREGSVEEAVRYMKAGASDFLVGEMAGSMIEHSMSRFLPQRVSNHEGSVGAASGSDPNEEILVLGNNPKILEVLGAIKLVAKSRTAVLITGESGTGKELVARMIHRQSDREKKPFVALNCAAIPRDLIESELFGHEKGAFTGASTRKEGCFELANDGTLFFDEIAEMDPDTQAKLLRAIEHQSFRRVGGKEEVTVDVRALAATNKNIHEAMKTGDFREDLYYRFSVIEIHLPPLRERKDDIPLLLDHFLSEFGERYGKFPQRFSEESVERLVEYTWPGNIRELRNIVERSVVICPQAVIGPRYLPRSITQQKESHSYITIPLGSSAREAEKMLILETLAAVNKNKSKAARILGLSRKTLHNKLHEFGTIEMQDVPSDDGNGDVGHS